MSGRNRDPEFVYLVPDVQYVAHVFRHPVMFDGQHYRVAYDTGHDEQLEQRVSDHFVQTVLHFQPRLVIDAISAAIPTTPVARTVCE